MSSWRPGFRIEERQASPLALHPYEFLLEADGYGGSGRAPFPEPAVGGPAGAP